jgi:hypothetical protein
MSARLIRSFVHLLVLCAICILLTGFGYATDNTTLPAKYPDEKRAGSDLNY